MATILLCAFLITSILQGQEADTSITIAHFMYPEKEVISVILDEAGENSFFLDKYYPSVLNDYSISKVMIDGALHLPQGSYFLPQLLPTGTAPDSIHNYSQIYYQKGDYNSGQLGLSLQIEGADSSYFSLQGFRQSPPVIYSYSSWDDNLQNYVISYNRLSEDAKISVDIMYHLEDYHLSLSTDEYNLDSEYEREVESFHGGLGFERKWENFWFDLHPAFQMTHANRHDAVATYFTLWNNFSSKLYLGDHYHFSIQQQSKILMAEKDSDLSEIETHIVRPMLVYHSGVITLEGGVALYNGQFEPEGKVSWRIKNLYLTAVRELHLHFEPVDIAEYKQNKYYLTSFNIRYIINTFKVLLDIFQVRNSTVDQPGIRGEFEIDLSWLIFSQKVGIYNMQSDHVGPVDMFNHMSLLFSPNIWLWRTSRFQPFMGFESYYIQHSGIAGINPTTVPIIYDSEVGTSTSNIINLEFGILVNRFKISYRFNQSNILGENVTNSSRTHPLKPVQQLVVVWQFWN